MYQIHHTVTTPMAYRAKYHLVSGSMPVFPICDVKSIGENYAQTILLTNVIFFILINMVLDLNITPFKQ